MNTARSPVDADGIIHSRVFPGLRLHVPSLLIQDGPAVTAWLRESLASAEHAAFVEELQRRRESENP